MRKIDLSRHAYSFFANVERMDALRDAAALEKRLEQTVVAWLYDTGLWGAQFVVQINPVMQDGAITGMLVQTVVDIDHHIYLVESQNGKIEESEGQGQ